MGKSPGLGYSHNNEEPSPPLMDHSRHPDGPPRSMSMTASEEEREVRMTGQLENDGKHSLLQFALKYFRQKDKFQHVGVRVEADYNIRKISILFLYQEATNINLNFV